MAEPIMQQLFGVLARAVDDANHVEPAEVFLGQFRVVLDNGSIPWHYESDFTYSIPSDFSMANAEALSLILEKLQYSFCVEWNLDSGAFDNFNQGAFFHLISSMAKSGIHKASIEVEQAPRSCDGVIMDGLRKLIQENAATKVLQVTGLDWGPVPEEEIPNFMPSHLAYLRHIVSSVEQYDNNILEELRMDGFVVRTSCEEFCRLLSCGPQTISIDGGWIDLFSEAEGPMGGYKGPRKVSLGGIGRTPETDVLLTKVLASCPALEELEVYAFSPDSASIEVNHQSFVLLLQQVKVRKLFLSCDVDNDYNLENIFHPLKDNHFLEELSIDLRLPATVWMFDGGYTPDDAISPTGWDWLCYSLCQVLCGILEESNMTLKKVGWCENGNSPSRLYKDAMDPARYLAALNFFGRGQVRRGECENIGDLLAAAKVEIMQDDTTYGFGFASIAYGLLRESPSLWAQV